jgi:polar amino acid transport system substrate-binding protein
MATEKTDRRAALKYAAAAIGGLAIGSVAGWSAKPTPTPTNSTISTVAAAKFGVAPPAGTPVTIIHGFDAAYPPFTEIDPTGKAIGFDCDVLATIAQQNGWTIVEKPWDWSAIVPALLNGELDIIMSGMTVTAARCDVVTFTLPYYPYVHYLITLATEKRSMTDILTSGATIAVQTGGVGDMWATKLLAAGDNFQKLGLDTYELAMEAVLDGRAVGTITDSGFSVPYFKSNPDKAALLRIVGTIGGLSVYAIATRNGDSWLRDQLNLGLENLMGTNTWNDLLNKWDL